MIDGTWSWSSLSKVKGLLKGKGPVKSETYRASKTSKSRCKHLDRWEISFRFSDTVEEVRQHVHADGSNHFRNRCVGVGIVNAPFLESKMC